MKYFKATVLSLIVVFGAIRSFHIYQISASTPEQAVSKYWTRITKDSPGEVKTVSVVYTESTTERGNALTVLFRATQQDPQMYLVGYAVTKKGIFGWYVENSQFYGKSPRPDDVIVELDQLDEKPVLYGQVFLADAAHVEAIFSDRGNSPITVAAEIPDGNFVLLGSQYQELLEFNILDSNGNVLKRFAIEELQNQ